MVVRLDCVGVSDPASFSFSANAKCIRRSQAAGDAGRDRSNACISTAHTRIDVIIKF